MCDSSTGVPVKIQDTNGFPESICFAMPTSKGSQQFLTSSGVRPVFLAIILQYCAKDMGFLYDCAAFWLGLEDPSFEVVVNAAVDCGETKSHLAAKAG